MNPIAIDFETEDVATGEGCLEMYRSTAKIKSVAAAWRAEGKIVTAFLDTPRGITQFMTALAEQQLPLLVYNVGFEGLCFQTQFPGYRFNVIADVMRLVQLYANDDTVQSYGLENSAVRILGCKPWKQELYRQLESQGVKKADVGKNLHHAPAAMFKAYNEGDVIATLELYEKITAEFKKINFDWKFDTQLYLSSAEYITKSKARGVRVDREKLTQFVTALTEELEKNEQDFKDKWRSEVSEVEERIHQKVLAKYKTERGRAGAVRECFNVGSTTHLTILFRDVMQLPVTHTTPTGEPSMKAEHMIEYGEPGQFLANRKEKQLLVTQANSLLALSEYDGRFHIDIKLVGTSTGRYAGGKQ